MAFKVFVFYTGLIFTDALIHIELHNEVVSWTDCILRKSLIPTDVKSKCYRCSMTPSLGVPLNLPGWNQKYVNCSEHCEYITICTEAKYYTMVGNNKDPLLIPVCYQCENRKTEDIYFQLVRDDGLCSKQCVECAGQHDILTATECARQCTGLPTFCYPRERWFNHLKCYRATSWYGCVYKEPKQGSKLSNSCKECAKQALTLPDAQECAVECDGLPTYTIKSSGNSSTLVQCVERPAAANTDFFYYDIPHSIARFMHVSNPAEIYPAKELGEIYLSSRIGKMIFRRFNMSLLTWPRPAGYEELTL